jgi:methyl-accepting chemotaxis protein
MRFHIMGKLLAAFLLFTIVLSGGGVYFLGSLRQVSLEYEDVANRLQPANTDMSDILAGIYRQASAARGYILYGDSTLVQDLAEAQQQTSQKINDLRDKLSAPEHQTALSQLKEASEQYAKVLERSLALAQAGNTDEAKALMAREAVPLFQRMTKTAEELNQRIDQQARVEGEQAAHRARLVQITCVAVMAGAVLLAVVLGVLMARNLSRPIAAVAQIAQRLAAGDMTVESLRYRGRDEVGDMARAFNQMVANLRELLTAVQASTQAVMAASEELSAASEQAAQAAQGAAQAVSGVASGTTEQAQFAADVSRTVSELQQTIQQIADGAGRAAADVQQAAQLLGQMVRALDDVTDRTNGVAEGAEGAARNAESGVRVVSDTVQGMERIRQVVGEAATRMRNLEQLSAHIGEITVAISTIAEQTNLLALNAAIEAARAGDHGRGFAVVADEVRRLAERSAASAKEIAGLIANIQTRTAEVVEAMEQGTQEVERGSRLAAEAGQALQAIWETARGVAAATRQIAQAIGQVRHDAEGVAKAFDGMAAVTEENTAATEEMAASTQQVTEAVSRISQVAHENASAATEVSASVEELTAASEEVASSAQSLARIAQDLQEKMARFKL